MDFDEAEHLTSSRRAVREICAGFDDAYWRGHDSRPEFPWEFHQALALVSIFGLNPIGEHVLGLPRSY